MEPTKIVLFKGKTIRKTIHNNKWWFSVVDVCEALTDSIDAGAIERKHRLRALRISEHKPGVLDKFAAEQAKLLDKEITELDDQASRFAEEIKELESEKPS